MRKTALAAVIASAVVITLGGTTRPGIMQDTVMVTDKQK